MTKKFDFNWQIPGLIKNDVGLLALANFWCFVQFRSHFSMVPFSIDGRRRKITPSSSFSARSKLMSTVFLYTGNLKEKWVTFASHTQCVQKVVETLSIINCLSFFYAFISTGRWRYRIVSSERYPFRRSAHQPEAEQSTRESTWRTARRKVPHNLLGNWLHQHQLSACCLSIRWNCKGEHRRWLYIILDVLLGTRWCSVCRNWNFSRDLNEEFVKLMLLAHFTHKHQQQRADIQIQLEEMCGSQHTNSSSRENTITWPRRIFPSSFSSGNVNTECYVWKTSSYFPPSLSIKLTRFSCSQHALCNFSFFPRRWFRLFFLRKLSFMLFDNIVLCCIAHIPSHDLSHFSFYLQSHNRKKHTPVSVADLGWRTKENHAQWQSQQFLSNDVFEETVSSLVSGDLSWIPKKQTHDTTENFQPSRLMWRFVSSQMFSLHMAILTFFLIFSICHLLLDLQTVFSAWKLYPHFIYGFLCWFSVDNLLSSKNLRRGVKDWEALHTIISNIMLVPELCWWNSKFSTHNFRHNSASSSLFPPSLSAWTNAIILVATFFFSYTYLSNFVNCEENLTENALFSLFSIYIQCMSAKWIESLFSFCM